MLGALHDILVAFIEGTFYPHTTPPSGYRTKYIPERIVPVYKTLKVEFIISYHLLLRVNDHKELRLFIKETVTVRKIKLCIPRSKNVAVSRGLEPLLHFFLVL